MTIPLQIKLRLINQHLNELYGGHTPFQIMTRLLEECGELAEQVNHFEDSGIKRQKHGEPSREALAKEIQDVLRCLFQLVDYYDVGAELDASIAISVARIKTASANRSNAEKAKK